MNTYLDRLENAVAAKPAAKLSWGLSVPRPMDPITLVTSLAVPIPFCETDKETTLLFNNPVYTGESISSTIVRNLTALSSNLAYAQDVTQNLTVLSSIYSTTYNGLLQGLLYVPDLKESDPCAEYERAYVPDNAVRQINLPHTNYNLVALAPWFNDSCTQAYLKSVQRDTLRAMVFYLPNTDSSQPPDANSDVWTIDNSHDWKDANHFPVFAISGALGTEMMYQLSRYSGNISEVPNGKNISALYGPGLDDYVRIWTQLTVRTPSGLPHAWEFLLVILGVVFIVSITITFTLRLLWQRRRLLLQQRVIAGEVNLEALCVKRLVVPMYYVEKFPLFLYNNQPPDPPDPPVPPVDAMEIVPDGTAVEERVGLLTPLHSKEMGAIDESLTSTLTVSALDYQPLCQICLEEFKSHVTIIRELPCGHIFHPGCIDEFLSQMSSLCPLCKASMLPLGYCPPITNTMVRRERAIQRLRARVIVEDSDEEGVPVKPRRWRSSAKRYLFSTHQSPAIELEQQASQRAATRTRMHFLAGTHVERVDAEASANESWAGRLRVPWQTWASMPFLARRTSVNGPPPRLT